MALKNMKRKNQNIEKGSSQIANIPFPSPPTRNSVGTQPLSPQTTYVRRCSSALSNGPDTNSLNPQILHHAKAYWQNKGLRQKCTASQVGTKNS